MSVRIDPFRNFRFLVQVDGIERAGFSDVVFGNAATEIIEYREGTDLPVMRKLSGLTRYGTIQLRWGITDSRELYDWHREIVASGAGTLRRNMTILLLGDDGAEKSRWEVANAWPVRYDPPDFSARESRVAIEMLEIVHEGFERVR